VAPIEWDVERWNNPMDMSGDSSEGMILEKLYMDLNFEICEIHIRSEIKSSEENNGVKMNRKWRTLWK
jgi:hypothetical protein